MASLIAKKKANQLYYYVVESARVDCKPRIVHQTYLGIAEKVAALVKDRTAPVPVEATAIDFGLPGSLWLAAQKTGVLELLQSLWPQPRSGPSPAHYLTYCWPRSTASANRAPKPKLPPGMTAPSCVRCGALRQSGLPRRSSGTASTAFRKEELDRAQIRLLGVWKQKQLVSRRLLAYDTTNFYTYVASTNTRNELAQRGHNKQGRHNLRQVGLSYVMDGDNGLSLCHHVYPGNRADADELPPPLARIDALLDHNGITRDSVTLVLDKGSAALANTLELEKAGVGWISALPWNQAPSQLRDRSVDQLPACGSSQPGVRAAAVKTVVHGKEYLCVLKYSACFASEQLNSVTAALSKVTGNLRRFASELSKPKARYTEQGIRNKINRWLLDPFVREVLHYGLQERENRWHLTFEVDTPALQQLWSQRLGRTLLLTNRMDWTTEQVVTGYSGQQQIERVFRGLKDGEWLGWGPMYHWTDSKIRVHAFYCMLGISLLQYVHRQSQSAWPDLSVEQLLEQLSQIQQFTLLYPPLGDKGPNRVATLLSKQTLTQQALAACLGLDQLGITPRR
jgi:transposase